MHHLLRVVRLKPLEHLRVVDGARQCFEAEITEESNCIRLLSAVEENSELDLLVSYKEHTDDPRIPEVCDFLILSSTRII